jgi:hypothetical protein
MKNQENIFPVRARLYLHRLFLVQSSDKISCSVSFAYWTRLLVPSETGACLSLRKQKRQSNETDSIDDYEFLTNICNVCRLVKMQNEGNETSTGEYISNYG